MSGSTQKKLTQSEFYKLCEYLKSRKADLESNPYTLTTLAQQATASLKIPITPKTVSNAIAAVDIKLKVSRNSRHGILQSGAIRALARAHVQLCRDLGNHCPPEIELLAQE